MLVYVLLMIPIWVYHKLNPEQGGGERDPLTVYKISEDIHEQER